MGNPKYQRFFALIDDYVHGRLSHSEELEMKRAMKESKMLTRSVAEAWKTKEVAEAEAKIRGERVKDKLSGELTLQQELQFAEDLEEDTLLKEELDLEGQVDEGFRQLRYQKFKAEADRWKEDLPLTSDEELKEIQRSAQVDMPSPSGIPDKKQKSSAKVRPLRRWLRVAVGMLLLIVAVFLLIPSFENDKIVLAANESFSMPQLNGVRGGTSGSEAFAKGSEYYQSQYFEKALGEFQKIKEGDPDYSEAQFLIGLIGLKVPDFSGLTNLKRLYLNNDDQSFDLSIGTGLDMRSLTRLDLSWYLALGYLQEGKKKEGMALLDSITANVEHPFYEQAKALRIKIE